MDMRAFLVLSFVAFVSAGQLEYNYQLGYGYGSLPGITLSGLGPVSSGLIGLGSGGISNLGIGSERVIGVSDGSAPGGVLSGLGPDPSGLIDSGIGDVSNLGIGLEHVIGVSDGSAPGGVLSGLGPDPSGVIDSGIGSVANPRTGPGRVIGSKLNINPDYTRNSAVTSVSPVVNVPIVSGGVEGGLNKEFYYFSAPEEDVNDIDAAQRAVAVLKKKLRVVFIQAPENNGLNNAALQLARQATQDKTAIYVLSKQPDISELADQVEQLRDSGHQKPEVRFIKYRTSEDAINAQQTIQQQYDGLGGSSRSSNEGIAPVLNYASTLQLIGGVNRLDGSVSPSNLSPIGSIEAGVSRQYLPASVK